MPSWLTTRFVIELDRPRVMGIVNVTPDSFHDGGQHASAQAAIAHCERLCAEGADLLDIGGESTRPGAVVPDPDEERRRVIRCCGTRCGWACRCRSTPVTPH